MDFNGLMQDLIKLDKINKELQELQKPEVIQAKAEKLMDKAKTEKMLNDFNNKLDDILKDLL